MKGKRHGNDKHVYRAAPVIGKIEIAYSIGKMLPRASLVLWVTAAGG